MAVTPVPSMTAVPSFPSLADRAAGTYNSKAYAFGTHMSVTFNIELIAVAQSAYNNALDAAGSASCAATYKTDAQAAATAAASAAGAQKWISGTNYTQGAACWSPLDGLPYRLIGPSGVYGTDPKNDPTNWKLQVAAVAIKDEGSGQTSSASSINFVGDNIVAAAVGTDVTVTVETDWASALIF